MDYLEEMYEKWRNILFKTVCYLAGFVLLAEMITYFILQKAEVVEQTLPVYFLTFLIIPTILNLLIVAVGYYIMSRRTLEDGMSNYIPVVQMVLMCIVVASIHSIYSVTLCTFAIPMFATIVFNDKKMTRCIGQLTMGGFLFSLLFRWFFSFREETAIYFLSEAVVAAMILLTAYWLCSILLKNQQEKNAMMEVVYKEQLNMQERLNHDEKTGLYGFTAFENRLNQLVEEQATYETILSLVMIDIDNFKRVNDTYGHTQGDRVLLMLAEVMKQYKHENYFAARFGGEEFAIITVNTHRSAVWRMMEEMRVEFKNRKYDFTECEVTFSCGIAIWEKGWTAKELFDNADRAMYFSKLQGKDKTTLYEGE